MCMLHMHVAWEGGARDVVRGCVPLAIREVVLQAAAVEAGLAGVASGALGGRGHVGGVRAHGLLESGHGIAGEVWGMQRCL